MFTSGCFSNPLVGIPSIPVITSQVTQGMDLLINLHYRQGVGFMGGWHSFNLCQSLVAETTTFPVF